VAWIGLDWADETHAVCLQATGSADLESSALKQTPEALQLWVAGLRCRFPQGKVAIALEQSRGALFYALMTQDFLQLYPIPPQALADYRQALYPSGSKHDPGDAQLLLEFLRKHSERFHPWVADTPATREIALLVQYRRKLVNQRTALTNRLQALLKGYFPQALDWWGDLTAPLAWDFLSQFPSLSQVQKASRLQVRKIFHAHARRTPEQIEEFLDQIRAALPLTTDEAVIQSSVLMVQVGVGELRVLAAGLERIDQRLKDLFAAHPDHEIFASFPGAGAALAPRLLAAWGSDRQRITGAVHMQQLSGIAPVTSQSGKKRWVHWRWACSKFFARPSTSSPANPGCGLPGRTPTTNSSGPAAPTIRPPSAAWLTSGFVSSIAVGKIIRFTMRLAINRPWRAMARLWPPPYSNFPDRRPARDHKKP